MLINSHRFGGAGGGGGSDPSFASVVFLSGFEGADASTSFIDESSFGRTVTAVSGAQVDTDQFKFGASSLLLNGSTDAVTCVDSTDFEFGAGQYTVEAFVRFSSVSGVNTVMLSHANGSNVGWQLTRTSAGLFQLIADNGAGLAGVSWTPTVNTWYHVCADRDASGHTRSYIDGVFQEKSTNTNAIGDPATTFAVGRHSALGSRFFPGWIDEVRITKGVGRYASDSGFTVPTATYPRS